MTRNQNLPKEGFYEDFSGRICYLSKKDNEWVFEHAEGEYGATPFTLYHAEPLNIDEALREINAERGKLWAIDVFIRSKLEETTDEETSLFKDSLRRNFCTDKNQIVTSCKSYGSENCLKTCYYAKQRERARRLPFGTSTLN